MNLVICLILAIVVAAAVCGVVSALLKVRPLNQLAEWGNVLYALVVLLVVLAVIAYCFPGFNFPH